VKASDLNLAELMQFSEGRVAFHGRRLILHDLHALGQFRRDLIEMMGHEQAQRILTRKGYFWGQSDAAALQQLFEWDNAEEWLKAGQMLSRIAGLCESELRVRQLDSASGAVDLEVIWRNSSEVEQHLKEFGRSEYPICWVLAGYASGYASYCLGRSVYYIETHCQANGAPCCVAIGKDLASWGKQIEPHLAFFHAADIQRRVRDLTDQLERQQIELTRQRAELEKETNVPVLSPVVVRSAAFRRTLELANRVAKFDTTVLISGETGAGKEVVARYIHQASPRAHRPMLAINCSAMPETLLESELFGHRAGAFTGATRNQLGLFEEANGGTVFLDEIGDVPPAMQVKLLRVLQEREVRRVGESYSRPVDVRVISATNQDLESQVAEGRFREDLFFRLHVVHLRIPPLRERREDILPLARHFLKRFAERLKLSELRLAPDCVDALTRYPWPGNVRELENTLEHAVVMCSEGIITADLLPLSDPGRVAERHGITAARSLASVEREHIKAVLQLTGGNRGETARILEIGEATLYRRLRQMSREEAEPG
jgi:DNA-binding NtrC family response regulator/predicted hydrocarbon binding protein